MKMRIKVLTGIGILVVAILILTGINILQNGIGGRDGRSVEKILGMPPEKATLADIEKLSKSDVMQLFYAASPPEFSKVNGEYKAKILQLGVMGPIAPFYTKYLLGPGDWKGKAFYPLRKEWRMGVQPVGNQEKRTAEDHSHTQDENIYRKIAA